MLFVSGMAYSRSADHYETVRRNSIQKDKMMLKSVVK